MRAKFALNSLGLSGVAVAVATGALLCGLASASQAGKQYNESVKELEAAYQKVLAIMTEPEDRRLFVNAQQAWQKYRDAIVAFHGRYYPGSKGGLFVATDLNQARTEELKVLLTAESREEHESMGVRK